MENLRELLGDMSPLDSRSQQTGQSRPASKAAQSGMSVSFGGDKASQPAMSGASSMSTSDVPSRASNVPRKPLGESNMDSNITRRQPAKPVAAASNKSFEFKPAAPLAAMPMRPPTSRLGGGADQLLPSDALATPNTPAAVVGDSGLTPGELPQTPPPAAAPKPAALPALTWVDILTWKSPFRTVLSFLKGLTLLSAVTWVMYGSHGITLVSGLAYAALLDLGLNFLRFFVSSRWQHASLWAGSSWTGWLQARASAAVSSFAVMHDAYLSSMDPVVTLRVAAGLWAMAWLGTTFSAWPLIMGGYLAAYLLPPLYAANKKAVDGLAARVHAATWAPVEALEMPRTSRLAAIALALAALFFVSTWAQFAIGAFVAATYWRTTLLPQDVEAIREAAAPYTKSVRKTAKRLSMALDDAMVRYSAGPATRTKSRMN